MPPGQFLWPRIYRAKRFPEEHETIRFRTRETVGRQRLIVHSASAAFAGCAGIKGRYPGTRDSTVLLQIRNVAEQVLEQVLSLATKKRIVPSSLGNQTLICVELLVSSVCMAAPFRLDVLRR